VKSLPTVVVDTNVFLRFFAEDDPDQAERAAALFRQAAEGSVRLLTYPLVIAEIVWTLESWYRQPRRRIREVVEAILVTRNLKVQEADVVRQAIAWYDERRVDFVDAYVAAAALAAGHPEVVSFDRSDFRRLAGIRLRTP
jgi:predicted nucleic-acid-binding protein